MSFLLVCCSRPVFNSDIVARVGKETLTRNQVEKQLEERSLPLSEARRLVSQWINTQLLYQAALNQGMQHDKRIQEQIDDYRRELLGQAYLEMASVTAVKVTNADIRKAYDSNIESFYRPIDEARINHFILSSEREANLVRGILRKSSSGSDRKDIFSTYKVETALVERGALIQPLDDAIFNKSSRSSVIGPVKSDAGYHVIELLDKYKEGTYRDIDEVYDELRHQLYQSRASLNVVNILDSLRTTTEIEINLGNFSE